MWWADKIFSLVWDIQSFFLQAYFVVHGWIWPFNYLDYPLYAISWLFREMLAPVARFSDWTRDVWAKVEEVFSLDQIVAHFRTWIDYAIDAWTWVRSAWINVFNLIGDWWSSAKYEVMAWIDERVSVVRALVDQANAWLTRLQADLQWFLDHLLTLDEIIQWWKDWLGRVLTQLLIWGFIRILDVVGLIATAFIEREDFWAGWQDWRGMVAAFFDDPLEFLWELATDWFVGPEE